MRLLDVQHVVVDYDKKNYCGHPRQCGIANFGGGEIAVLYRRAPCEYEDPMDVAHSPSSGYMSRSDIVLRRSYDHGRTWKAEHDVIVWSNSQPMEKKLAFLSQDPAQRKDLDMRQPGAMLFIGFTSLSARDPKTKKLVKAAPGVKSTFQIRSVDKGRTWESVPLPLEGWGYPPVVMLPDGTFARNLGSGQVFLSLSKDQGMSWQKPTPIPGDPTGVGRASYSGLVALTDGRLQCYMYMAGGFHALAVSETEDLVHWSPPRPIVRYGHGPWAARRWMADTYTLRTKYGGWGQLYRSPWPLRLRDGRILVHFARREYPPSMAVIASEDGGRTWSGPAIIRDDASGSDMGYPVATELDNGRIFVAYYYQLDDGNNFNGTCFIGGSCYTLS